MDDMINMLTDPSAPFTATTEERYEELRETLRSFYQLIPEAERIEIVRAMKDIHQGNWFKCSNNHIYAIGECSEAVEAGACPVCKEVVGGVKRNLVRTSRPALEMDGDVTRHAAEWKLNDY